MHRFLKSRNPRVSQLFLLSMLLAFPLFGAGSFKLEIDPELPAESQGFIISPGPESIRVCKEGDKASLLCRVPPGREEPVLHTFINILDGEKTGALEICAAVRLDSPQPGSKPPVMRIAWPWGGSPRGFHEIPLIPDGEMHRYRVDLSKLSPWTCGGKREGALWITPCVASAAAEVKLYSVETVLTPEAEFSRFSTIAGERLQGQKLLISALKRNGIPVETEEKKIGELTERLSALTSSAPPEVRAGMDAEFRKAHAVLAVGRRLAELREQEALLKKKFSDLPEVAGFSSLLQSLAAAYESREFARAETLADRAESELRKTWNKALESSPLQPGVSDLSFGRFGWVHRSRGGLTGEEGPESVVLNSLLYGNGSRPALFIKPAHGDIRGVPDRLDTGWISCSDRWQYQQKDGTTRNWIRRISLAAPGSLVETDAPAVTVQLNGGEFTGPGRIVGVFNHEVRQYSAADFSKIKWNTLSENWILLFAENNFMEVPWLLTLSHRPDQVVFSDREMEIRRKKGVGTIGISAPWGRQVLPAMFSSGWKEVPKEIIARARQLNEIMTCFPYSSEDFFQISPDRRNIRVETRFQYRPVKNEWNNDGKKYAPVPPLLNFAAQNGYPAAFSPGLTDTGMMTKYGAYTVVPGDISWYELPVPDLRPDYPLNTPWYPERKAALNEAVRLFPAANVPGFDPARLAHSVVAAPYPAAWNMLTPGNRAIMQRNTRLFLQKLQNNFIGLGTFRGSVNDQNLFERAEPFTGRTYPAYGWRATKFGSQLLGDITNYVGFFVAFPAHCIELSGDWETARQYWPELVRFFQVCPRRFDWATMGQDCMEYTASQLIDMGPDSWIAAVSFARMAPEVNDRRTADLALYIATQQAVPLVTNFYKRPFDMSYTNTWNREKQLPESGWTESGEVCGAEYTAANIVYNSLSGVVFSREEYQLYRRFCKQALADFALGWVEKYYPQWRDPAFRLPGASLGENSPGVIIEFFQLHEMLGNSNEFLERLLADGLGENQKQSIGSLVPCFHLPDLSVGAAALLIGRDAPCSVAGFAPAALEKGEFDPDQKKVVLQFRSPRKFIVHLRSAVAPDRILLNGELLKDGEFSFAGETGTLLIPVAALGGSELQLFYPQWRRPVRTTLKMREPKIDETPQMRLAEQMKMQKDDRNGDFQILGKTSAVNLSKAYNTALGSHPVSGWFGKRNGPADGGMSALPRGEQIVRGVPFHIEPGTGMGAIGLYGSEARNLPRRTIRIPVGKKLRNLYFLHTAGYDSGNGKPDFRYIVHFQNGQTAEIPVRSGIHIADWWERRSVPGARLTPPISSSGHAVGCYVMKWSNDVDRSGPMGGVAAEQLDYRVIQSLEIQSDDNAGVAAVLAITGEEP